MDFFQRKLLENLLRRLIFQVSYKYEILTDTVGLKIGTTKRDGASFIINTNTYIITCRRGTLSNTYNKISDVQANRIFLPEDFLNTTPTQILRPPLPC